MDEHENGESSAGSINPDDVVNILLASDIHLGYKEDDKERGQDSFNAFEEVLQIAVAKNVDFILLGGDLFDKANPSTYCLNRCLMLLRTYCMGGDKPILIEFLSDQRVNFKESLNQTVNYEDENLNISIPVFSIHGNHDDASCSGNLSALDILSTSGLVNYFGKLTNLQNLEVNPIMLQKGQTKIAIYGLSYIQDNRLTRLFDDKKVKLALPENTDTDWFNIFVLHQNRANRGMKNYLPEESLPEFLDFVVWGHEHDCRIEPEQNSKKRFFVCQPGSTVATSLAGGEAGVKKCALLQIHQKNFKLEPITLQSVRPFVFDTISIGDVIANNDSFQFGRGTMEEKVQNLAREKIKEMLKKCEELRTGHPKQPKLPLIRLRIEVTETNQMFQIVRFGQAYGKIVANSDDMILFKRQIKRRTKDDVKVDKEAIEEAFLVETEQKVNKVEDVVKRYFDDADDDMKMKLLSMDAMAELTRCIIAGTSKSDTIFDFYLKEGQKFVDGCAEEDFEQKLADFRAQEEQVFKGLLHVLDTERREAPQDDPEGDEEEDESPVAMPATKATRGRGRGTTTTKAATTTRGRGRGRGANSTTTKQNTTKKALNVSVSNTSRASKGGKGVVVLSSDESD
ncbi:double-strand break repair protein MRE11 [Culicoides brevitarsis]|uniref:double-strand break repair protein MRE11 n=1 Tax=Culicoides brevitarsis TaxID=469753 RepID=UPI00307C8AB8